MSVIETYNFMEPERKVLAPKDIENWEKSEAYQDILGFLTAMNESVRGKKLSCECFKSETVEGIEKLLDSISLLVDETPPIDQPQRYGNKAFRDFYQKMKDNVVPYLKDCLPEEHHAAIVEISLYLTESFGNSTRIDYGTGHELSFIMFLCTLHKIGLLKREDSLATVVVLFRRYLDLCRKLQMTYKMEPAGSQGVWSLDDYQFVPFIWGSSQLVMNPKISPEMFTSDKIIEDYSEEYLFIGCVKYIKSVKTGPFAEHSNQLWNISAVQSWSKINQGLFKMYRAEILNKFPIIQHVLFGSILSFAPAKTLRFPPSGEMGLSKGSVGMMAKSNPRTCMIPPGPGRMPPLMGRMPAPGPTVRPPCPVGMAPVEAGMMPGAPARMPTGLNLSKAKEAFGENATRMPTASGSHISPSESVSKNKILNSEND